MKFKGLQGLTPMLLRQIQQFLILMLIYEELDLFSFSTLSSSYQGLNLMAHISSTTHLTVGVAPPLLLSYLPSE